MPQNSGRDTIVTEEMGSDAPTIDLAAYVPATASLVDHLSVPGHQRVTGTVLFVDVTGFTALSERLARRGKVGAEEITEIISNLFDRLLIRAFEQGGDLLKFGGDALLLLFTGDFHRQRGIQASDHMQEDLAAQRVGGIRMRMSGGLASGPVDLFLVGDPSRELILSGATVDRALALEKESEPGETRTDSYDGNGSDTQLGPGSGLDPGRYIPPQLRPLLGAGQAEHRAATIGFGKINVASLSERPSQLAAGLHAVVSTLEELAEAHGVCLLGTDVSIGGVKLLVTSGAPVAHGDNEERMLRLARAITELDLPLPVQFGVATGRVFAGEIGTGSRRVYTVMGDTVNLAARLVEVAAPGEILATERVLERSRAEFEVEQRPSVTPKGKQKAVTPLAIRSMRQATGGSELPLIGRDDELALLLQAAQEAYSGQGNVAEVVAPAGVGKSRLVAELARRAENLTALTVACEEYGRADAFGTARRLMCHMLGADPTDSTSAARILSNRLSETAPELVPWIPLLGPVLGVEIEHTPETSAIAPQFRADRRGSVAADVLAKLIHQPTLLWIEDSHWMDAASVEVLIHLMKLVPERPWLMLLTRRPAEQGLWIGENEPGRRIELEPLDSEASRRLLVEAAADNPMLPDIAEEMLERAEGNPFFLLGLSQRRGDDLPETVEAMVAASIDQLEPSARHALRSLSVLGQSFSEDMAAAMGDDQIDPVEVARQRLSDYVDVTDGGFHFRHALLQETAYEGLPYRVRRRLHARAADALEASDDVEQRRGLLSVHCERAGRWDAAWKHSVLAGGEAKRLHAIREAIDQHRRALRVSRHARSIEASEVAEIAEALGDLCDLAGRQEEATSAYQRARPRTQTGADQARLMMKLGMLEERTGQYPLALRWLTRARKELEDTDHPVALELDIAYAGIRFRQDRYREALDWCDEAIRRAKAANLKAELAHAYYLRGHANSFLDRNASTDDHLEALAIYEEVDDILGQANVYNNLGLEAYYRGDWPSAVDHHQSSEERRRRGGDTRGAAVSGFNRALVLFDQGRLAEAKAVLEEVRRVGKATGSPLLEGAATCYLAAIAAREGDIEFAMRAFEDALEKLETTGADFFINDVFLRRAEAAMIAGDFASAQAQAERGVGATEDREGMEASLAGFHRVLGAVFLERGMVAEAENELRRVIEIAQEANLPYEQGLAADGLAAVARARGEDPSSHERARDEIFDRLDVVEPPPNFDRSAAGSV
ncbi:MAG TPA: adenylate/guanylate cyclase domain-containing protein [Acidimicrobiia bacterium]|nr:adenylate/guanylate cyclase domain-containing protein [Acidimicrobiia bacterium]